MPSVEEIAAFLDKIHIFKGISEDHLFDFAENFEIKEINADEEIIAQGEQSDSFYIIFSGKIKVKEDEKSKGQKSALYERGDYLGAESLLPENLRTSGAKAKKESVLLKLSPSAIAEISGAVSFVREKLANSLECRELAKKMSFDWVEEDEAIYFAVHKHVILFWKGVVLAIFLGFLGIIFTLGGMWAGSSLLWIIGVVLSLVSVVMIAWDWVDWRNDYYVVTNHRVVWVEKVVGIHDSRQEAILHEVQSVGTDTDLLGRYFDFGSVTIRTMVGQMTLKYMPCPERAHILIEELWHRAQSHEKQHAKDILHQAILDQIKAAQAVPLKRRTAPPAPLKGKDGFKLDLFSNKKERHLLTLRFEQGAEIIYRKHFIMLIRNASIPALVALFFFAFSFFQLYSFFVIKDGSALSISFIALLFVAGFISLGIMQYQYMDWSNDIFKVSKDKIFDIDRKPFGDVQSRSAPLENIESLEYKRSGPLSVFFNYGTIHIHIGSEHFEFENVFDPALVQQDINRRYAEHYQKKKEAAAKKERDQIIKWLVAYHQSTDKVDDMLAEIKRIEQEGLERYRQAEGEDEG